MKSYAVVLLSAGVLGTVIGFAQSTKETSASHVAVAKAAARQEHTALSLPGSRSAPHEETPQIWLWRGVSSFFGASCLLWE